MPLYTSNAISFSDAWASLWIVAFVVGFVLIALEGAFFMKSPAIHRMSQFGGAFLATGVVAAIAAVIASSHGFEFTLPDKCRRFIALRPADAWLVRFVGVAGLYAFLYVACGSAVWPLVRDYYRDPNSTLALRVPSGRVIIPLQLVRGLLTTISLVPLISVIPASDTLWWLKLALLLATVMAIGPLLLANRWPARLRWLHAVEISVFAMLYSLTVWWFIARLESSA